MNPKYQIPRSLFYEVERNASVLLGLKCRHNPLVFRKSAPKTLGIPLNSSRGVSFVGLKILIEGRSNVTISPVSFLARKATSVNNNL